MCIHTPISIWLYQLTLGHVIYYFIFEVALGIIIYSPNFSQSTLSLYFTTLHKSQKTYNNIIHFAVTQISAISIDVFPFFIIQVPSCVLSFQSADSLLTFLLEQFYYWSFFLFSFLPLPIFLFCFNS